jgi:DHA3 family tetracycline resistance protein-like MFS transporter
MPAYPLYLALSFFTSLFFSVIFVVTSFYEATVAGLTGLQLVLVGTTLEVVILLFEVPTGIIADAYSRKLSIVLGYFIMGAAFLLEGLLPVFPAILLASGLWGLGYTFTSGATQAWLSDEIGEEAANRAFLRANQWDLSGAFLGMALAIPLGNGNIALPILAGGGGLVLLALAFIFLMPETRFAPAPAQDRNTWQRLAHIFSQGLQTVRSRPALWAILGVGLMYGLNSEGWDRLWVKHLTDTFGIPRLWGWNEVAFLGILRASGMLLALFFTRLLEKRLDSNHAASVAQSLFWLTSLFALAIFTFTFAPSLAVAVMAVLVVSVTRNLIAPLYNAWVNQKLNPETRATVLSMSGQVDAIGQIASGPLAGLVSLWSVQAAIAFAGLLLLPALPLIRRAGESVEVRE